MSDAEGCCSSAAVPRGLTFCTVIAQHQKKSRVAPLIIALYFPDARLSLTHPPEHKQPTVEEHATPRGHARLSRSHWQQSWQVKSHLIRNGTPRTCLSIFAITVWPAIVIQTVVRSLSLSQRYRFSSDDTPARLVLLLLSHRSRRRNRVAVPANRRWSALVVRWLVGVLCVPCDAVREWVLCSVVCRRTVAPARRAAGNHRSATAVRPPCAPALKN